MSENGSKPVAGVRPSLRHWKRIGWVLPRSPPIGGVLCMKVTMLSLMASIPLITLSVGSVPAFAQSPANVSQQLSQRSSVTPSTSSAIASSQPVVSHNLPAAIAKKLPMTPANLQQTIGTVNRYIQQNAQGLAHIRVAQHSCDKPASLRGKFDGLKHK